MISQMLKCKHNKVYKTMLQLNFTSFWNLTQANKMIIRKEAIMSLEVNMYYESLKSQAVIQQVKLFQTYYIPFDRLEIACSIANSWSI